MPAGGGQAGEAAAAREPGLLVLERLRDLPGGRELLDAGSERPDLELIGGATRDLLLDTTPRELDVVVADGADELARELAAALGGGEGPQQAIQSGHHERFGTSFLTWAGGRIDIATRRAESYGAPGALPEVRGGTPEQDLLRRDFTVNAIAVGVGDGRRGELRAPAHALEDLARRRLRVLHEHSFRDDPTRLLRLARYMARLGFAAEERTAELADQALRARALQTVSGARIGAELRLALAEPDPVAALSSVAHLGVLAALEPPLGFDARVARAALGMLPADGRQEALLLACLLLQAGADRAAAGGRDRYQLLDALEFGAAERDRAIASALLAPQLAVKLDQTSAPSQLRAYLAGAPVEAVALAASLDHTRVPTRREPALRWLDELRHVRLRITGDDLLAAGIPAGPEIGRRLAAALDLRLDGVLDDSREAQLSAALDAEA